MKSNWKHCLWIGYLSLLLKGQDPVDNRDGYEQFIKEYLPSKENSSPPPETSNQDPTILGPQMINLIDLLDYEAEKANKYLEENEEKGKNGFLYVLGDVYKALETTAPFIKSKGSSNEGARILRALQLMETIFPNEVRKRHLEGLLTSDDANKITGVDSLAEGKRKEEIENYARTIEAQSKTIIGDSSTSNDQSSLTSSLEANGSVVIDETQDFLSFVAWLAENQPPIYTNKQIQQMGNDMLIKLQKALNELDYYLPQELHHSFNDFLGRIKTLLSVAENITVEHLKQLFYAIHSRFNGLLDAMLSKEGFEAIKKKLQDISLGLWDIQAMLNSKLSHNIPLKNDLNWLMVIIRQKLWETGRVLRLSDDQKTAFAELAKSHYHKEFTDIDYNALDKKINDMGRVLKEKLLSRLETAFSEVNMQRIVHGCIEAMRRDAEHLRNPFSPSGFVLNASTLHKLQVAILAKIKAIYFDNDKVLIKLPDNELRSLITSVGNIINEYCHPEKIKQPTDAKELYQSLLNAESMAAAYESDIYEAVTSHEFQVKLAGYIRKYLSVLAKLEERVGLERIWWPNSLINQLKADMGVEEESHSWFSRLLFRSVQQNLSRLSESDIRATKIILAHLQDPAQDSYRGQENSPSSAPNTFGSNPKVVKDIITLVKDANTESKSLINLMQGALVGGLGKLSSWVSKTVDDVKQAVPELASEFQDYIQESETEERTILKDLINALKEGEASNNSVIGEL